MQAVACLSRAIPCLPVGTVGIQESFLKLRRGVHDSSKPRAERCCVLHPLRAFCFSIFWKLAIATTMMAELNVRASSPPCAPSAPVLKRGSSSHTLSVVIVKEATDSKIGISFFHETAFIGDAVVIATVKPKGLAAAAGLVKEDVVLSMNGRSLTCASPTDYTTHPHTRPSIHGGMLELDTHAATSGTATPAPSQVSSRRSGGPPRGFG